MEHYNLVKFYNNREFLDGLEGSYSQFINYQLVDKGLTPNGDTSKIKKPFKFSHVIYVSCTYTRGLYIL